MRLPLRCALAAGVLVLAGALAPLAAQPPSSGALTELGPEGEAAGRYAIRVTPDTVYIGEEGGASVALTPLTIRAIGLHLDALRAAEVRAQTAVGYRDGRIAFAIGRHLRPLDLVLGGLLLAAVGAGLEVARRHRRSRRARAVLVEAQRAAVESREAERRRIARELHDGPVQHLSALQMGLALAGTGPPHVAPLRTLDEMAEDVEATVRELRALADDLRPPALGPFGLTSALDALVDKLQAQHPAVRFTRDLAPDGQRIPERARLALFRVAQEALHNALKHAAPHTVAVRLRLDPALRLDVSDDGRGMAAPADPAALRAGGHFGLLGLMERAELLGGTLTVASRPGEGTRVGLVVPWTALAEDVARPAAPARPPARSPRRQPAL